MTARNWTRVIFVVVALAAIGGLAWMVWSREEDNQTFFQRTAAPGVPGPIREYSASGGQQAPSGSAGPPAPAPGGEAAPKAEAPTTAEEPKG
jgi:hypothetical protein